MTTARVPDFYALLKLAPTSKRLMQWHFGICQWENDSCVGPSGLWRSPMLLQRDSCHLF